MYIIITRWMTHPLFLLFAIVVNLFIGDYTNVFIWIFIWLFLNLIFGRNSYLYKLWERKKSEISERRIATKKETEIKTELKKLESEKEDNTKKPPKQHYKLWGEVEGKVEKSTK